MGLSAAGNVDCDEYKKGLLVDVLVDASCCWSCWSLLISWLMARDERSLPVPVLVSELPAGDSKFEANGTV